MNGSIKDIAIIMDGNGRWAKEKNKPRFWGHIKGSQKVSEITATASHLGLKSLTLYAFSTENWNRPDEEVKVLLKLLKRFLKREFQKIIDEDIQFRIIGNYNNLDKITKEIIFDLEKRTSTNKGLNLNIAFNYGGRKEIVDSINKILKTQRVDKVTEDLISENLYNPAIKNVDLIIRTGGDKRISNFLLWESSYSEICFIDEKWPDFTGEKLEEILSQYSKNERRFGAIK